MKKNREESIWVILSHLMFSLIHTWLYSLKAKLLNQMDEDLSQINIGDKKLLRTFSSQSSIKRLFNKAFKIQMSNCYLSVLGFSWGVSSGQALPSIRFLASAYSASRWARDLTCGVGLFGFMDDAKDPLLAGRFNMRICGGGPAGKELSWITMAVFNGDWEELLDSLRGKRKDVHTDNKFEAKTNFSVLITSVLVSYSLFHTSVCACRTDE